MTAENGFQVSDLYIIMQAVSMASQRNTFNEIEINGIKPSFSRIETFLESYRKSVEESSKSVSEAETKDTKNEHQEKPSTKSKRGKQ